jgi:hypothetical protein
MKSAPVHFVMTHKGWHHIAMWWWDECGQKKCEWLIYARNPRKLDQKSGVSRSWR